ncbi:MAG: glucose 1-dehydrogenase [Pseudomonadota bacterium]
MTRYRDKVVLITGAAGGFGRLAAERFAAEGARLALSDLSSAEIIAPDDALALPCDVASEPEVATLITAVLERFGRIDVAVNCAGVLHAPAKLAELSVEAFDHAMTVNARGVFLCLKHQLPAMAAAGGGAILNIASAAGLVGAPTLSAYAASKHAVIGLTRSAADEYARMGVRVNALCPAFAATGMINEMTDRLAPDRAEAEAKLAARIPMRRIAQPEEVVEAMLWLCSDANSFMTGQAVALDGGLTAV